LPDFSLSLENEQEQVVDKTSTSLDGDDIYAALQKFLPSSNQIKLPFHNINSLLNESFQNSFYDSSISQSTHEEFSCNFLFMIFSLKISKRI
jgi:hypothetical protein